MSLVSLSSLILVIFGVIFVMPAQSKRCAVAYPHGDYILQAYLLHMLVTDFIDTEARDNSLLIPNHCRERCRSVRCWQNTELFNELLSVSSHLKHYRRMYSENSRMVVVRQELTALIQLFPQVRTAAINPFLSYPDPMCNVVKLQSILSCQINHN